LTAAAVARFQANHGLRVDGVVDLATRRAMRAPVVLSVGAGELGAEGSRAVARVQVRLRRLGFDPGPVDGRFGPRTERAVLAFQRRRHLSTNGVVGVRTERALYTVGHAKNHHPVASAPVKQTRHKPSVAPRVSTPVTHAKPHAARVVSGTPSLPGIWILVGLGALGLIVVLLSYRRSRRRTGAPDTPTAAAGADPTAEAGGQG
jgi:peptidoglycan hydrolase-like protein with peptidoglycan-binding domain